MKKTKDLKAVARGIKKLVVEMAYRTKTSHIGPSLSISDILAVLYFKVLNIDPKKPTWINRDYFILSKGHAASALYATLALKGYFPLRDLMKYRVNGGIFHGHPCRDAAPGIELSTGSLGHGLAVGAGLALAAKIDPRKNHVYVLLGDGECDEGSVWEAAKYIGINKMSNVTVIVDWNKFQGFEVKNRISKSDLKKQWEAFGWKVYLVSGHDLVELGQSLKRAKADNHPSVIIADTISGRGLLEAENNLKAHYYIIPNEESYQQILKNINEK